QEQHVAVIIADEQVELAVAIEISDCQAGGQVAGTDGGGPRKTAVAVAEEDRDRTTSFIQNGEILDGILRELAGDDDGRTDARRIGVGRGRIQQATVTIRPEDRKAAGLAVDRDHVASGTALKMAANQASCSRARTNHQLAIVALQPVEPRPGAEPRLAGEASL